MKLSNLGMKKIKLADVDENYSGQNILMKLGELYQFESGIYGYGTILTMTAVPFENYVFSGWFMGDEKLSSDDTYSFVVEEDMQVTALFDEDFSTGIDSDARTEAFVIRPLPLHDVMRLDGNFIEVKRLLVYAIDGTVKLAESDVPRGASVDVSSLAKGLYIVKAVTDNGTYVKRVLKK